MTEIWKPCSSVEGLEASSLGRIRVVPHYGEMPHGGVRRYGGHEWFGCIATDPAQPRRIIRFRRRTYKVHRLICEAFHGPEPFANADVLHRNRDTLDNAETNLRWATRSEVILHMSLEKAA